MTPTATCMCLLALLMGAAHSARVDVAGPGLPRSTVTYTGDALKDKVTSLPGWGALKDFNMFSGYITVDEQAGRRLFYVYVESSVAPDTQPLLLWLNGGPGCSSVGGGFLSELGPFLPLPGGAKLQANPYAWNRVANVLFLDSPAFVGFSTSDTPADAVVGDARTAADSRKFLLGFIQRFPHLADRDMFISGESYAGHYVPTLAWEIVQGNQEALRQARSSDPPGAPPAPPPGYLNLRGLLVGNPWTDAATDNLGAVDYWWAHALISDRTALGIKANCDFERIGPLDAHPADSDATTKAGACDKFCNSAAFELGPINIYHIYADVCPPVAATRASAALQAQLSRRDHQAVGAVSSVGSAGVVEGGLAVITPAAAALLGARAAVASTAHHAAAGAVSSSSSGSTASLLQAGRRRGGDAGKHTLRSRRTGRGSTGGDPDDAGGIAPPYDPCVDNEVETYLNLPEVQRALHANVSGELPGPWSDCNHNILYSREDLLSSMLPVWKKLIDTEGLRVIIYSGDVDGIVPVVGTRRWVSGLGLMEVAAWRPWSCAAQGQVGGYTVEYQLPWQARATTSAQQQQQQQPQQQQQQQDQSTVSRALLANGSQQSQGQQAQDQQALGQQQQPQQAPLRGGFVFATVRGAGHMVPYVQPQRALHLLARFLQGRAL